MTVRRVIDQRMAEVMAEWTELHWQAETVDAKLRWCGPSNRDWLVESGQLHSRIQALSAEHAVLTRQKVQLDAEMLMQTFGSACPVDCGMSFCDCQVDDDEAYEADMADRENDCRKAEGR